MNLLLDPDVAYILLVLGSILTLLAIVAPGTGMLEIGAFFFLVLAGYSIYHLGFNLWALIALVLAIIPFIYAIRRPKREWALALSLLGFIVGSLYLFPTQGFWPAVNPILAIIVSVLATGFLWLVVRKAIQASHARPVQDLKKLINQTGEAKTRVQEEGSVQVAGELWSARSEKTIPAGNRIRVIDREGFTLVVERDDHFVK